MFTFIHSADIHLDSLLEGLGAYENAPAETIRGATRVALANLVELAIEKQVDFLLISGDLYNGSWKDFRTGRFFVDQMLLLKKAGIPVYLISGNHDAACKITNALILPENVHTFSTKKAESWTHPTLPVTLHGQSFATPAVTQNLAINYPPPIKDSFNIGLLHTNLGDREGHGNYAPCKLNDLISHGYSYWALGHIHLREIHHQHPHVVYSGNIQGRHINETGAKGCYLVRVNKASNDELTVSEMKFCPLDIVRWQHLHIDTSDLTGENELFNVIKDNLIQALAEVENRLLAVRITLTGATELHGHFHVDIARLQAECVSIAADITQDQIWIESLRIKTKPKIDPHELAERDDLAALVLQALDTFDLTRTPKAIMDLEKKLPPEAKKQLRESLAPATQKEKQALRDDIAALVLNAISTSHT